jgi:GDP-L-fucose synthase
MDRFEGPGHINVGTGIDHSIAELAMMIRDEVHPGADLVFDASKPDGMPRRVLDVTAMTELGWRAAIDLRTGIARTYDWYREATDAGLAHQLSDA